MSLTAATRAETPKLFSTSIWWILALVLFAIAPATLDRLRFNPALSGQRETTRVGFVTDHNRHLGVGNSPIIDRIAQRQHV